MTTSTEARIRPITSLYTREDVLALLGDDPYGYVRSLFDAALTEKKEEEGTDGRMVYPRAFGAMESEMGMLVSTLVHVIKGGR